MRARAQRLRVGDQTPVSHCSLNSAESSGRAVSPCPCEAHPRQPELEASLWSRVGVTVVRRDGLKERRSV